MIITSLENKKIKKYIKLKTKKYRDLEKLFLVEGEHLVLEALKSNSVVDLLVLEGFFVNYSYPYTYVSEAIMKKLSNMDSIPKVIAVVKFLESNENFGPKILLLDDIQDPGNLGTIIRSSLAFNVTDIILNSKSVDLYNDKVVRSSQGMLFHMNILRVDLAQLIPKLKQNGYLILGTNVSNGSDVREIKSDKFALLMGNEGSGVKMELASMCDKNLYIKMNNNVESLNVGVATSILLYELNR